MPSNTYDVTTGTYPATTQRDVSPIITSISPVDTYIYSHIPKGKASATFHEWLEEALDGPRRNAQPEGFTYFTEDVGDRLPLGNYAQIMSRGIHITKSQEAAISIGVRDEMAHQMAKQMKQLAFDCEMALITQTTMVAGAMGSPGIPREMAGLPFWIKTNKFDNGGTLRPLTFDLIALALEATYGAGGSPKVLIVSPRNKMVISRMVIGNTKFMKGTDETLKSVISTLETDFGVLHVVPDRWLSNKAIFGLSMEYLKKSFYRPFVIGDVAPNVADVSRRNVVGEWTLEMRAEGAHFMIDDLDGILPPLL
jgi:hypothetical protein